jgi:proline iminopeptidase
LAVRYHRAVLFVDLPPRSTFTLAVSHGHLLHVEESGAPEGMAALVLHGGPGSGCSPLLRRYFDPLRWRIVCVDQRGAGLSRPRGETAHNTTEALLADLRALREALGIERWVVVGGSWGATLAILHAIDAPDAVAALLLRAVFLARSEDIDTFFAARDGLPALAWQGFADAPPTAQRALALDWWHREQRLARPDDHRTNERSACEPAGDALAALVDRYRVQCHYLRHGCWLGELPLLERARALPRVPTLLLQGEADQVCPLSGARALHQQLPHAALWIVKGAGHDPGHPAMATAMVHALAGYARRRAWPVSAADGADEGVAAASDSSR